MKEVQFIFPFPPSVNTMFFQGKNHGQKFLSKRAKEYKQALQALYADVARVPMHGDLEVQLYLVPPDARRRDVDNYLKAVLDGLTELNIIEDDSQIGMLNVRMLNKITRYNRGFVIVQVLSLENEFEFYTGVCDLSMKKEIDNGSNPDETLLYFIKPTKKNPLHREEDGKDGKDTKI